MKGNRGFANREFGNGGLWDLGNVFDEIFGAAQNFRDEFQRKFHGDGFGGQEGSFFFDENTDYYPNYSYPPMNVYMTGDKSLIFEFALAGFCEKDISLSFQGDYMVFSAAMPQDEKLQGENAGEVSRPEESVRYFKRRLKMKGIEKQKYFVPLDKYSQEKVKAVFRNGILKVSIPPKDEPDQAEGIKIEIINDN